MALRLTEAETTCNLIWQTTHPGQSAEIDVPTEVRRIIITAYGAYVTGSGITGSGSDAFSGHYMDP